MKKVFFAFVLLLSVATRSNSQNPTPGGHETIVVGGQVAETDGVKVRIIPLREAPPQLLHAMEATFGR